MGSWSVPLAVALVAMLAIVAGVVGTAHRAGLIAWLPLAAILLFIAIAGRLER